MEPLLQRRNDERSLTTVETLEFLSVVMLVLLQQCSTFLKFQMLRSI